MNFCPQCNSKMRTGKKRTVGSQVRRHRYCKCGYADRAYYTPEVLVRTERVLTRTDTSPKAP